MEAYLLLIVAIVASVVFSAFFSAAETAVTGVSPATIHKLIMEGNKRARMVAELREDKERLISALLFGNNALNIFASALATQSMVTLFGDEGVVYATIMMTLIILVFAEVLPKTYAFENAEKVALAIVPVLRLVVRILYPITTGVQMLVSRALRWMNATGGDDVLSGTEELRGAIELYHQRGSVIKHDRDMLESVLRLKETDVGQIMVHRSNLVTINIDLPITEIISQMLDSTNTRIPLWQDDPENIVGVLHLKDLLRFLRIQQQPLTKEFLLQIAAKPWFIPSTTLLSDQLHEFRKRRVHFALVVDEYGALLGVVTLEDILEEIVGQIHDEHDPLNEGIKPDGKGGYIVEGSITIRDLNRYFDWDLPEEDANTIAGLLMHETQTVPDVGQIFHFYGKRFEILAKHYYQITSIHISVLDS